MYVLAQQTRTALRSSLPKDAMLVLTAAVEPVPLERFLTAQCIPGERLLWDPGERGDGWAWAGRGEAVRVMCDGNDRLAQVRKRARALFERVVERKNFEGIDVPSPRLFGGISFRPGAESQEPWSQFGDGRFVLPRWLYGYNRSENVAVLRLALRGDELLYNTNILEEIRGVTELFARPAVGEMAESGRGGTVALEEMPEWKWKTLVTSALETIRNGVLTKVVLARRSLLSTEVAIDPIGVLRRLAEREQGCIRFGFESGGTFFLGASPERLVWLQGRRIVTEALAGSLARTGNEHERERLLQSEKDRREHALVLEAIQCALEPFCDTLEYSETPTVRSLRRLHHLCTPVSGRLRSPVHVLELVEALHPTPAVCGLPRQAALQWLTNNEPWERGWYAAPVGWFDGKGDGDFVVAIRSAVIHARRAWLYAGAGIVEGSDPVREYAETGLKQTSVLDALGVGS